MTSLQLNNFLLDAHGLEKVRRAVIATIATNITSAHRAKQHCALLTLYFTDVSSRPILSNTKGF
jgi:hypothetical protein